MHLTQQTPDASHLLPKRASWVSNDLPTTDTIQRSLIIRWERRAKTCSAHRSPRMTIYGETLSWIERWIDTNQSVCGCRRTLRRHVSIHSDIACLQTPQDNVWRGMFLIGLLAMQLISRAMPPVRR